MDGFTFGKIIFIVATVFIGSTFIFVFAMFFSPKLKGKADMGYVNSIIKDKLTNL